MCVCVGVGVEGENIFQQMSGLSEASVWLDWSLVVLMTLLVKVLIEEERRDVFHVIW